jgi:hypothetical protein
VKTLLSTALIGAFLVVPDPSAAQQRGGRAGQPRPNPERLAQQERGADEGELSPGQILQMFDTLAIVQAEGALRLTQEQYPQFVGKLRAVQQTRRRNQQARNQIMMELRRLINQQGEAAAADEVVSERLKALGDHDARAAAELRGAYEALDQVLDIRQQARFRLFEENLERRKFELLSRARRARPR